MRVGYHIYSLVCHGKLHLSLFSLIFSPDFPPTEVEIVKSWLSFSIGSPVKNVKNAGSNELTLFSPPALKPFRMGLPCLISVHTCNAIDENERECQQTELEKHEKVMRKGPFCALLSIPLPLFSPPISLLGQEFRR